MVIEKAAFTALEATLNGIRWGHLKSGFQSPTDNFLVKLALKGGKRILSVNKVNNQKEPITTSMLKDLAKIYGGDGNLVHQRFLLFCLLGFSGFLRISELLCIQIKHIVINEEFLEITLPKSKTDQFREGHKVYVADIEHGLSPKRIAVDYLKKTNLIHEPESFLISRLAKTKKGHRAIGKFPLSYTTVRESFLKLLKPIFQDESQLKQFCTHSMRSGGATAASNSGVSEREIDLHGRWKSKRTKNRYIKDDLEKRLKISSSLGL